VLFAWTIKWAYERRPLGTAVSIAVLGPALVANFDSGNINIFLTLMVWWAQFVGERLSGGLWALATALKWLPGLLIVVLKPRARLWGLAFLGLFIVFALATWPQTREALGSIYEDSLRRGIRPPDRFNILAERRMGLPKRLRLAAPQETGPLLMTGQDWWETTHTVPIQPEAVAYGGAGVRIGVLDTPLVWNRAWGGNVRSLDPSLPSTDRALEPSATPESYSYDVGHANFVASLIAAQAPEADIGVLGTLRSGDASATAWDVARAMVSFLDRDVAILNLSLGCYTDDNQPPLLMQRAIQIMTPRLLVVAAAGNHRQPTRPRPFWPAALDDVIAVGAYGDDYRPAPFTPHAPWVDVVAPGVDIVTNYFDGCVAVEDGKPKQFTRYAKWQGTSFAAGLATGEIASRLPVNGDARWVRESLWSGTYDGILIKGSRAK